MPIIFDQTLIHSPIPISTRDDKTSNAICKSKWETKDKPCDIYLTKKPNAVRQCARLTDLNGPFAKCHHIIPPQQHHDMFMQDTCKMAAGYCDVMSAYAKACIDVGVSLPNWREKTEHCGKI